MAGNQSGSTSNNTASRLTRLAATFRAVRMEHLMAGITGGVVSTLVLHPLDLLKIRFAGKQDQIFHICAIEAFNLGRHVHTRQVISLICGLIVVDDGKTAANRPQYRGLGHAFYSIFKQEGATGLYKGVSPNVFGAGAAWGSYFLL